MPAPTIGQLKRKLFTMIHKTASDNLHYASSILLTHSNRKAAGKNLRQLLLTYSLLFLQVIESLNAQVFRCVVQLVFDAKQLVVFRYAVRT